VCVERERERERERREGYNVVKCGVGISILESFIPNY
jgi:hypothetical protein